jgi:hypothetical protein
VGLRREYHRTRSRIWIREGAQSDVGEEGSEGAGDAECWWGLENAGLISTLPI